MNRSSWENVEGIVLLLGAIVLIITGNEGWGVLAAIVWLLR